MDDADHQSTCMWKWIYPLIMLTQRKKSFGVLYDLSRDPLSFCIPNFMKNSPTSVYWRPYCCTTYKYINTHSILYNTLLYKIFQFYSWPCRCKTKHNIFGPTVKDTRFSHTIRFKLLEKLFTTKHHVTFHNIAINHTLTHLNGVKRQFMYVLCKFYVNTSIQMMSLILSLRIYHSMPVWVWCLKSLK